MQSRAKSRQISSNAVSTDERLDQAIFWITLGALFLIPLVFSFYRFMAVFNEPKIIVLHLSAGLIAILWLWQLVLRRLDAREGQEGPVTWDLLGWAGRNPARWALIGGAVWVFAQLAATLLSPLPIISFFGGDEARSGYNLYDSLSLTVIFLSVALRFRTKKSLEYLLYTLVITGTIAAVYGIAQHFGWDPIGNNAGRTRILASFGNTLNFGGYMVMSIPATIALTYKRFKREYVWWAVIAAALSLQLAGIWFSGGRGPIVAATAAIITFFAISFAIGGVKETLKTIGMLVGASIVAAIIIALPSKQGDIGLARVISIGDQFGSSEGTSTDIEGGLTGRFSIWRSALKLAASWDVPVDEPVTNTVLRPVFGLGPDMYVYSYPFTAPPASNLAVVDHTHNYTLMILMEHGFLGLFGFLALTGLITLAVFAIVRRYRTSGTGLDATGLLMIGLLPSVIGKLVEMQSGVGRVSDLAMNFAILGAAIAIYEIANKQLNPEQDAETETVSRRPSNATLSASNQTLLGASLVAAIALSAVILTMFIGWDVRRTQASLALAAGHDHPDNNVRAAAWAEAQSKAPERESFTVNLGDEYLRVAKQQHEAGNTEEAMRLINLGRNMLLEYERRDPFELDNQIILAKMTSTLLTWGNDDFLLELADRSVKMAETYPSYPTIVGTSATAMTSVGLHEVAIEYADRAIATESTTVPWAKAWYAKGRALYELGRDEEAIEALITATEKQPGAEGALLAHQALSVVYTDLGDLDLAEYHREIGGGDITVDE